MELKKGELNTLNNQMIYNKYLLIFNRLYKDYEFLGISKETFNKLVLNEIEISKTKYDEKEAYGAYLKEKVTDKVLSIINNIMNDNSKAIKLINNFIDINMRGPKNNEYITYYLTILDEFFNNINYYPDPDIIIEIINNKILQKILKAYIDNNLRYSNSDMNGENVIDVIIDTYCKIYNIENNNINNQKYNNENVEVVNTTRAYLNEIASIPPLTAKEEEKYSYEMLNGNSHAREMLIKNYLKLVVSIAIKYYNKEVPLEDLIQAGNEGLIIAADKYNIRKGYLFSTYAIWWIRDKIRRQAFSNATSIKRPFNQVAKIRKYNYTANKLAIKLGRAPLDSEIAAYMNIKLSELEKIKKSNLQFISIYDNESGDAHNGRGRQLHECYDLAGKDIKNTEGIEEIGIKACLPNEIKKIFQACNLSNREQQVLIIRYGIDDKMPKTLEETGKLMGNITKERVRQLESRALKKIRTSDIIQSFSIYMDNQADSEKRLKIYQRDYAESKLNIYKSNLSPDNITRRVLK